MKLLWLIHLLSVTVSLAQPPINRGFYDIHGTPADSADSYYYEWYEEGRRYSRYTEGGKTRMTETPTKLEHVFTRIYFHPGGEYMASGEFAKGTPLGI